MRVRLLPNTEEGWTEEFGELLSGDPDSEGCYMVRVDNLYRVSPQDDGLREVTRDQWEEGP